MVVGEEETREGVVEKTMESGFLANVAVFEVCAAVEKEACKGI
jgi:hypothetical protein